MELSGFICVDKPAGISSHDVVAAARRTLHTKKIGHSGTLDPFATGLLVLGVGKATRLLQYIVDGEKVYHATIRLGSATHSDDLTGEFISQANLDELKAISEEKIRHELQKFIGTIQQKPSSVSAIKVDGKRAYALVREGVEVDLPAREVQIASIDILSISYQWGNVREKKVEHSHSESEPGSTCYLDAFEDDPAIDIDVVVRCGAGTYIRSIARDLGLALGVGGHLTSLRRTVVSPFTVDGALLVENRRLTTPESIAQGREISPEEIAITSIADGVSGIMGIRQVSYEEAVELSFGRPLSPNEEESIYCAVDSSGQALALIQNKNGHATPMIVFSVRG